MRARRGSRRTGAIDVPANSQVAQITMIITVSTAILAAASVVGESARWALAKTAAIATQAFGLAMPRSAPPMSSLSQPLFPSTPVGNLLARIRAVGARASGTRWVEPDFAAADGAGSEA